MSSHSPDVASLIGRAVTVSIAEPWDFRSAAGDNLLTGTIVAASSPTEAPSWLLCDVSPFIEAGRTISMVAAVRRHAGEEPLAKLDAHGVAYANLLYDSSGATLTPERVRAALATQTNRSSEIRFVVGSIRLS
jgi:hypothetical protein